MKTSVEKLEKSQVKLHVTLTKDEFALSIDKAFQKIVKDVEVPGFRKGKISKQEYIKRKGVASLYQDAIDFALEDSYYEAVKKEKLDVVSQPEIDIDFENFGEGKPFNYTAVVSVYPEVVLGQYFGVEVTKESAEVTEEEINESIARDLKSKSDLEVVENGTLENGMTAIFDFDGSVDGVHFDGGKAENYTLEIGSGSFIPGFEEQMVGMKPEEEKTITVTFPEKYQAEELAGKKADFLIKLHEIKQRVLPVLNEEFVKEMDIKDVTTVEEYKKYVTEKLAAEKKEASENKFTDDVITKVCENATVDIPECLIRDRVDSEVKRMEEQAKMYGLDAETLLKYQGTTMEQYRSLMEEPARKFVLEQIVLTAIIDKEKIKLLATDYKEGYKKLALEYGKTIKEMEERYPKEQIANYFLMQKVIDLIKEKAIIK